MRHILLILYFGTQVLWIYNFEKLLSNNNNKNNNLTKTLRNASAN